MAGGETNRPGFIRIHFDTLAPVHQLLRRLIHSGNTGAIDLPALSSLGAHTSAHAYCLIDASINAEERCASVFQIRPQQRLLFGGIYLASSLATPVGNSYLEVLKHPAPAANIESSDSVTIDSSLATLLVRDGPMLRSAVLDDVTHLSAEQNYVRVHLSRDESVIMRGPLQKYASALPASFLRLSRRLIINVAQVKRMRRVTRDLCVVSFMLGEHSVRIGRKASVILRSAMMNRSVLPLTRASKRPAAMRKDQTSV